MLEKIIIVNRDLIQINKQLSKCTNMYVVAVNRSVGEVTEPSVSSVQSPTGGGDVGVAALRINGHTSSTPQRNPRHHSRYTSTTPVSKLSFKSLNINFNILFFIYFNFLLFNLVKMFNFFCLSITLSKKYFVSLMIIRFTPFQYLLNLKL